MSVVAQIVEQAKQALAGRDLAGALVLCDRALTQAPDDTEALYLGAVLQRMKGDLPAALALIGRLIALRPQLGRAWQERGHCLRQMNQREPAVAAYAKAVDAASNGEIKFKMFVGGALLNLQSTLQGLRNGVADAGFLVMTYWPAELAHQKLLGELALLGQPVEEHDRVPLGLLLLLAGLLVAPAFAGREPDVGDRLAARHRPRLRVLSEVADEDDFVDPARHIPAPA